MFSLITNCYSMFTVNQKKVVHLKLLRQLETRASMHKIGEKLKNILHAGKRLKLTRDNKDTFGVECDKLMTHCRATTKGLGQMDQSELEVAPLNPH